MDYDMTPHQFERYHTLLRQAMYWRRQGVVAGLIQNKHKRPVTARVISNIAKPWNGREALTPNIGKDLG